MTKKKRINERKEDLNNEAEQVLRRLMDTGYVNVGRFTDNRRNKRTLFNRVAETLHLMDMKFRASPFVHNSLGVPEGNGNKLNYIFVLSPDGK